MVDADCLTRLVETGEQDAATGIVGPLVYHYDEPGIIQSGGGLLGRYWESINVAQDEPDHGQLPAAHTVEWISGCALMVRRAVIEQVGVMDVRFFYYWDETEWCLRARKAGWRVVHVPAAKIWHKGVQCNYTPKPVRAVLLHPQSVVDAQGTSCARLCVGACIGRYAEDSD